MHHANKSSAGFTRIHSSILIFVISCLMLVIAYNMGVVDGARSRVESAPPTNKASTAVESTDSDEVGASLPKSAHLAAIEFVNPPSIIKLGATPVEREKFFQEWGCTGYIGREVQMIKADANFVSVYYNAQSDAISRSECPHGTVLLMRRYTYENSEANYQNNRTDEAARRSARQTLAP